jgi:hypothetical protein
MGKDHYRRQPVDSCEQGCSTEKQQDAANKPSAEDTAKISFRISVFYDGTGNNKLNTDARREVERNKSEKEHHVSREEKETRGKVLDELEDAYSYLSREELDRRFNQAKEIYSKKKKEFQKDKSPVSYLGAETNVYKMFRNLEISNEPELTPSKEKKTRLEWNVFKKFYIEGIGTFGGQDDSSLFQGKLGGALAIGESGIIERASQAHAIVVRYILSQIQEFKRCIRSNSKNKNVKKIIIENIWLDFFGFSRGAACARFSCKLFLEDITKTSTLYSEFEPPTSVTATISKSLKNQLQEKLQLINDDFSVTNTSTIQVKNVGIFDTVSSYGLGGTLGEQSNIEDLFLHSIACAENVFHISAKNEYRINFALTKSKCGKKLELPGAHSDIGGGYEHEEAEDKRILKDLDRSEAAKIAFWFKEMGYVNTVYFKDNVYHEINETDNDWLSGRTTKDIRSSFAVIIELKTNIVTRNSSMSLKLHRPKIFNSFSKIPLNYMLEEFNGKGLKFNLNPADTAIPSVEYTYALKSAIENNDENEIKKFRLNYFHFSGHNYNSIGGEEDYGLIEAYRERENKHLGKFNSKMPFIRKTHE